MIKRIKGRNYQEVIISPIFLLDLAEKFRGLQVILGTNFFSIFINWIKTSNSMVEIHLDLNTHLLLLNAFFLINLVFTFEMLIIELSAKKKEYINDDIQYHNVFIYNTYTAALPIL